MQTPNTCGLINQKCRITHGGGSTYKSFHPPDLHRSSDHEATSARQSVRRVIDPLMTARQPAALGWLDVMWSDTERLCLPTHTGAQGKKNNTPEQARSAHLRRGSQQEVSSRNPPLCSRVMRRLAQTPQTRVLLIFLTLCDVVCPCCRHQLQAGHSITSLHDAGMENKIQVVKGPFNILQLAQDKRSQFSSPGLPASANTGGETSSEYIKNGFFPSRHDSHSLHRHRAKLPAHQDGGAEPQLLRDHAQQLRRNRRPCGRLRPPARSQRGPVQPQHPVVHAARLHLPREFQGQFPGGACFDPPALRPCPQPPLFLLLSSSFLSSLSGLTPQTKGYSPDPTEPAVGSASPGFI